MKLTSDINFTSLGRQRGVCKDELWRQITLSLTSCECWKGVPYPLCTCLLIYKIINPSLQVLTCLACSRYSLYSSNLILTLFIIKVQYL